MTFPHFTAATSTTYAADVTSVLGATPYALL